MNLPPYDLVAQPSGPAPGEASFALHLDAASPAFRGHFPATPVLAGVIQFDWVMQLAGRHLGLRQRAADDFQVKFRRVIGPGGALSLTLRINPDRHRLDFEYWLDGESATLGQIRLAPA